MLAALFWFALPLGNRARLAIVLGLLLVMLALPFMAPAEHPLWRFIASILCVMPAVKVYDVHLERLLAGTSEVPSIGEYLLFLINPCMLVHRRLKDETPPPRRADVARLLRGGVIMLLGFPLLFWCFDSADAGAWPFWLEHSVKAVLAFAVVYGACGVIVALWRLMGFRGRTVALNFFAARTPAEFWRLYNRHTGQFFFEDVARPVQRKTGAAAATMVAFAVSGVLHEYLVFVAIGRVQLLQTSFFLVQGLAVVVTQRLTSRAHGPAAWLGIVLTFAFNLATSLLFFASINQFFPWYADEHTLPQ